MFNWKVEDMALTKNNHMVGRKKYYNCEAELSREDKIAFVDKMQDGKLSYILALAEKFNKEKEFLPKDKYGYVKTISLKAWIKKNDDKGLINNDFHYGNIYFMGGRNIQDLSHCGRGDSFEDYVDEVFHCQLKECERAEEKYFLEHDEYSILKQKFRDKHYYTTFGVHIISSSRGGIYVGNDIDNKREITIDELKELLAKYEQLDALVDKLTAETNIKY